ncbi:MAG: helix-turn-helix domain-containing protein [Candidatus Nanopelagicales bacterium]
MKFPSPGAERIARALNDSGPSTATALASRLELSGAVVRRHLDALLEAGLATASESPPFGPAPDRRRGRPARVFSLTDAGSHTFDVAYDDLAVGALRFMRDETPAGTVEEFTAQRATTWAESHQARFDALSVDDVDGRVQTLVDVLTEDGYSATLADGGQLCQHHCPVAHVAQEFPQICEAETQAFARLLGTHVMRIATISRGDGVCTTLIPTSRTYPHHAQLPARPANEQRRSLA